MNISLSMNTKARWLTLKYTYSNDAYISTTNGNVFGFHTAFSYLIVTNLCWHGNCECTVLYIYIYMQVVDIVFKVITYRII